MLCATPPTGASHKNKSLIVVPMDTKGIERARKLKKIGMWASDTAQIFFDDVRVPATQRDRAGGDGVHAADAAVSGGAAVGRGEHGVGGLEAIAIAETHRVHALAPGLRAVGARPSVRALSRSPSSPRRWKPCGHSSVASHRGSTFRGQGRHASRLDVPSSRQVVSSREAGDYVPAVLGRHGLHVGIDPMSRFYPRRPAVLHRRRGRRGDAVSIICKLDGTLPRRKKKEA